MVDEDLIGTVGMVVDDRLWRTGANRHVVVEEVRENNYFRQKGDGRR
jgi:hypothetical protein